MVQTDCGKRGPGMYTTPCSFTAGHDGGCSWLRGGYTNHQQAQPAQPTDKPFDLEDVIDEIRAMRQVCDEHKLGLRKLLPWQKLWKPEELERRKKVYQVVINILEDMVRTHRIVIR